ncbi:hypothetical protein KSP40_PGU013439 [Platanthera guangdongensis]|uniref:25S rRNA (uridine-N(3))-methyltransferase BMT5-like domain-containing protein n=1 Tax=Platanthera guangdongensis TaxID=2320717 RepID=A0ABR2LCJ6_9ASPA
MLSPRGEVHITHRDCGPYKKWNIQDLATSSKLELLDKVHFYRNDYRGYYIRRGAGGKSHKPFTIKNSFTFKFKAQ